MSQNKTNFGEKYSATREYLRQFEKGKKIPLKSQQQYYKNCKVKDDLRKKHGDGVSAIYDEMTQEEKNNYYKSLS